MWTSVSPWTEVVDGDVVVTHGASHHVRQVLLKARAYTRPLFGST
jgi:translation initiation factor 2B subunit (eIF-2B alpha/beta/delta family)